MPRGSEESPSHSTPRPNNSQSNLTNNYKYNPVTHSARLIITTFKADGSRNLGLHSVSNITFSCNVLDVDVEEVFSQIMKSTFISARFRVGVNQPKLSKFTQHAAYCGPNSRINSASLIQPFGGIQLLRDGRIFWGQMFVIKLGCPMFFHDFPFDVQVCKLEMASYFHSIVDMSFAWYGNGITASSDIQKLLGNYEFTFVQENVTSCTTTGYVLGEYPCLRSSMTFKRRYRNYLLGVYVPSSLFVVVSWASFFWPAEAIPARTVLLITALLTTISLYSGVQDHTFTDDFHILMRTYHHILNG
ncbi:glutamate-gated chloride channel alpha-like [Penaeus japonicus]|uniref:glutamate-gated chloride channel alpha-like n=1 Tax=Penaeus japonicus TaxID=27405 RepID=UPI001C712972|nr:glutamate-gated chloride channel alpha-like [Penaeus japonicus]